jgi:hypothetical protein
LKKVNYEKEASSLCLAILFKSMGYRGSNMVFKRWKNIPNQPEECSSTERFL